MVPKYYPIQVKGVSMLAIRTEQADGRQIVQLVKPDGSMSKVSRAIRKRIALHHERETDDENC